VFCVIGKTKIFKLLLYLILVKIINRYIQARNYNRKDKFPKKVNDQREKTKLGMEKHRHPSMGTSIPCTMDTEVISTSFP